MKKTIFILLAMFILSGFISSCGSDSSGTSSTTGSPLPSPSVDCNGSSCM